METLLLMLLWVLFCYVGIPAFLIFLFMAFKKPKPKLAVLAKPKPVPAEVYGRLNSKLEQAGGAATGSAGSVEPPKPWAESPGPAAGGGYWRKWTGTRRWYAAQDKGAWVRDFQEAEERAEQQQQQPEPPPLVQPHPAAPSEVFARLRSRLEQLG
ncbi:hypothetical protein [Pseudarthrobacter sp. MDT1-22]